MGSKGGVNKWPIHMLRVMLKEHTPITEMAQSDTSGSEMSRNVAHHVEGSEGRIGSTVFGRNVRRGILEERLKELFVVAVRRDGLEIEEGIVVFEHNPLVHVLGVGLCTIYNGDA